MTQDQDAARKRVEAAARELNDAMEAASRAGLGATVGVGYRPESFAGGPCPALSVALNRRRDRFEGRIIAATIEDRA